MIDLVKKVKADKKEPVIVVRARDINKPVVPVLVVDNGVEPDFYDFGSKGMYRRTWEQ